MNDSARYGERSTPPRRGSRGEQVVPLVCVHGLAGSSRWWDGVAGDLEAAGPVCLLDLPRSLRPDRLAGWVAGRIEGLGRPVDLLGHSMGALVAVRVAADRPDLVRRLILIAPPGMEAPSSAAHYVAPLFASLVRARPRFLVRVGADAARAGPRNLLRGGAHVAATDARSDAGRVRAPTLLIWGEHDRLVPSAGGSRWLSALPDARLHIIAGAAHVPMVESPNELVAEISAFRSEG